MIINRLINLAVCLLVLLNVVSTMGGSATKYRYYNSEHDYLLCLSLSSNRLTDCCRKDEMQQIHVMKTGPNTGFFHTKNFKRFLCYNEARRKFRVYKRKHVGLNKCRQKRNQELRKRHRRRVNSNCYHLSPSDKRRLKAKGCELYENLSHAGYYYISSKNGTYHLGIRNGRVQRHKMRRGKVKDVEEVYTRFHSLTEETIEKLNYCQA